KSPMPDDIIAPRLLTPGGMLVLGGAPEVGKSDFLISLLVHMAAGVPFLGFAPSRPLRIFYLQAEIQYHYLRERLQAIRIEPALLAAARDNLVATPKVRMLLDPRGVGLTIAAVRAHYRQGAPDILCIDPIRNAFDGGPGRAAQDHAKAARRGPVHGALGRGQPPQLLHFRGDHAPARRGPTGADAAFRAPQRPRHRADDRRQGGRTLGRDRPLGDKARASRVRREARRRARAQTRRDPSTALR